MIPPALRGGAAPSALLVVHGLPPEEHTGTPLAAHGYATELARRGWDVTVLYPSQHAPGWDRLQRRRLAGEGFWRLAAPPTAVRGALWSLLTPPVPADPTPPVAGPDAAICAVLDELHPDVVHVVDNVDLPLSVPELAAARGIPVVRTVSCAEDLCALVAPVSPLSGPGGYCPAPLTAARCAECVAAVLPPIWSGWTHPGDGDGDGGRAEGARRRRHDGLVGDLLRKRARTVRQFGEVYDRVVFASAGFRRYFEQTLPLDPRTVRVVPMGVDLASPLAPAGAAPTGAAPAGPADPNPPLRLVLLALADPAKGLRSVVEAFTHPDLAGRDDWRLVLAGGGDRSLFGPLLDDPRVTDRGAYRPADLPGLLGAADVGLSTSVFETFHRVTREYLAAGLAVVGSTAFGITDAVVPGRNGLRFDHAEPASLARAVTALADDRALLERLRAGARATPIRRVADEVDDLEALYRELVPAARAPADGG